MADIVDKETRSRMMSGIRSVNTKPEHQIRQMLHGAGFRFRLHVKDLPGKPDIVLPKYKAVIFVNGCFWHGHNCHLFKLPATRREFWENKIARNAINDAVAIEKLLKAGWRIASVWECALRGRDKLKSDVILSRLAVWLQNHTDSFELRGEPEEH